MDANIRSTNVVGYGTNLFTLRPAPLSAVLPNRTRHAV
jgi:hypothetical protein